MTSVPGSVDAVVADAGVAVGAGTVPPAGGTAAFCDAAAGAAPFDAGAAACIGGEGGFGDATTLDTCPPAPDHVRHTVATAAMPTTTSTATTAIAVRCWRVAGVTTGGEGFAIGAALGDGADAAATLALDGVIGARFGAVASASAAYEATRAASASAREKSAAVWKRSSGRFASAFFTTASIAGGNCTFSVDGGSGSSFSTFCIVVAVEPANG